jgi:ubiquinone/menaquinone biosynthesis C-methylase UbiE
VKRDPIEIRDHYRRPDVVTDYCARRFREPLGALLHARQVARLRALARRERPARVAELAAGPARLAVDLDDALPGPRVLVDTSLEMLAGGRATFAARGQPAWPAVQGDAQALPLRTGAFDLVYVFRLLRHFAAADRARGYAEARRVLRPGGLFVFDAVNAAVSEALRQSAPAGTYPIYDALFRPDTLRAELASAGFAVVDLHGVQHRYQLQSRVQVLVAPRSQRIARLALAVIERCGGEPLEWVVTCRRV